MLVEIEWRMFDKVRGIDGRAPCQDDYTTFCIMRSSQFAAWSPTMRHSYYCDLAAAQRAGKNLLSEKYAHMMARTNPAEYEQLKNLLPPAEPEKQPLIDEIIAAHTVWLEKLARQYPCLVGRGRAIRRSGDSAASTSAETYMWGELQTYSPDTVRRYAAYVRQLQKTGQNMNAMILQNTAAQYGYDSLEQAEKHLAARQ